MAKEPVIYPKNLKNWYIYLLNYHKKHLNVRKYTSPMDPTGYVNQSKIPNFVSLESLMNDVNIPNMDGMG